MNIICFLTVKPCSKFLNFCKNLKSHCYDVYIFVDDNKYDVNLEPDLNIIKIDNNICQKAGYKSSVLWLNNIACSRDKALYYFSTMNIAYNYIWFIEEDVFIPSIDTIKRIDNKYKNEDLLSSSHNIVTKKQLSGWHWEHVKKQIKLEPPYSSSMICAIRCSKMLVECIKQYVSMHCNLFLDEVLFNTIALHNNLIVNTIIELSTIVYRKNWKKEDINPDYLYHPVKSIDDHYIFRDYILKS